MNDTGTFEERRQKFQEEVTSEAIDTNIQASHPQELSQVIKIKNIVDLHKEADYEFNPNIVAKEIGAKQLSEFAEFVKNTPYEKFIAYKDPKVQELVDFIMAATIFEYERINHDDFPIEIHDRYKADASLKDKIDRYSKREEKKGIEVTDYLGFRILPTEDPSILFSDGDDELQKKIDKNEKIRKYLTAEYKDLSRNPNMTCSKYCEKCKRVLSKLRDIFPEEATERKEYYNGLINKVNENLDAYNSMYENSEENTMHYNEASNIISVNIMQYLKELEKLYPGEVILYKLNKNLLNVFENSELLNFLRGFFCTTF